VLNRTSDSDGGGSGCTLDDFNMKKTEGKKRGEGGTAFSPSAKVYERVEVSCRGEGGRSVDRVHA